MTIAATEPDLDPDLGIGVKALERRELARRRHGKRDARAVIRFGDRETGLALRLAIGDDIKDNVATRAAHLVLGDDPVEPQRNAELARQGLPQLDLEAGRIARLARERQRIGMGAKPDRAEFDESY